MTGRGLPSKDKYRESTWSLFLLGYERGKYKNSSSQDDQHVTADKGSHVQDTLHIIT